MTLTVKPLHPIFAAELIGADLTQPPTAALIETVEAAMAKYAVTVVRDTDITDEEHIRFSRAFGPLELPPGNFGGDPRARRLRRELFDASNLDENHDIIPYGSERRKLAKGAERFHSDSSFNRLPTKWSLLRGHIVPPEGGDTHFIDMRAVYDDLPQATKETIEDLIGIHDFWRGRERTGLTGITDKMRATMPAVQHRLVRMMPYGRKALFIGGHATGIVGWSEADALKLLDELYALATQDKYIYEHKWRQGDITIWDNRATMHRATPFTSDDYKRDVRRTTINEHGPETSSDAVAA